MRSRARLRGAHAGVAVPLTIVLTIVLACVTVVAAMPAAAQPVSDGEGATPADLVNPFVGTTAGQPDFGTGGGAGNTFPGATVPFGMLQWSPDTEPSTVNFAGGYSYEDSQIEGFGVTHFSGAGCAIFQDVPILPTAEPVTESPVQQSSSNMVERFLADFDHDDESASPGAYAVALDPGTELQVDVELAASTRAGVGRFAFPRADEGSVLVNAGGSAMANEFSSVTIDPRRREIVATATSGRFCYQPNSYTVHVAIRFDRPFAAYGTWRNTDLHPGTTHAEDEATVALNYQPAPGLPPSAPGDPSGTAQAGAYVTFDTRDDRDVRAAVGVSFASVDNARANLDAEVAGRSVARVRASARDRWNEALGRIRVSGGEVADRRTFYTALYHALLHPNVLSDVNGEYPGFDGEVHRADGYVKYANYSGWDIYRSQVPLVALLDPARASDMVQSLVVDAAHSGWLPKWSVAATHTDVMVGDPADLMIAGAHAFGARDFDTDAALAAMVKGATEYGRSSTDEWKYVQRQALNEYETLGYVPHEEDTPLGAAATFVDPALVWGSAATTLEYALADFAIARFAAQACNADVATRMLERSGTWREVFDTSQGYVVPRSASGVFRPGYDPASGNGFVEGSGAQYTWHVPHDVAGLVDAMGGRDEAAARLDAFFAELNAGPESEHAFLGNEPSLHTPWLYAWVGEPWKTQRVVRDTMLGLYDDTPGGLPGNDDGGTMSAWYVFAALGMYPAVPGSDVLAVHTPLFEEARLDLPAGTATIRAPGAGRGAPFVREVRVDGAPLDRPWMRMGDLLAADTVEVGAATSPSRSWGSSADAAPPSFGPADVDALLARDCGGAPGDGAAGDPGGAGGGEPAPDPTGVGSGGAALPATGGPVGPAGLGLLLTVLAAGRYLHRREGDRT